MEIINGTIQSKMLAAISFTSADIGLDSTYYKLRICSSLLLLCCRTTLPLWPLLDFVLAHQNARFITVGYTYSENISKKKKENKLT